VGAECFQYVFEIQCHCPRRVYRTIAAFAGIKTASDSAATVVSTA
jgi:hypothetical protein